jgi:uncharacterized protein YkwD
MLPAVCATAVLLPAAPASAACADASLAITASNTARVEAAIVCLVNEDRAKQRRPPLKVSAALSNAARAHTKDMDQRNYFNHISKDGRTPLQRARAAGFTGSFVGENIANGARTAASVMSIWLNSAPHRKNIRSKEYATIGAGAVPGDGALYTLVFGTPKRRSARSA